MHFFKVLDNKGVIKGRVNPKMKELFTIFIHKVAVVELNKKVFNHEYNREHAGDQE